MRNRREFIDELGRVFAQETTAHALLEDIGYPVQYGPLWVAQANTVRYWNQVVTELENGRVAGHGPETLAEAAHRQYPGNRVFLTAIEPPEELAAPRRVDQPAPAPRPAAAAPAAPHAAEPAPRVWPTLFFTGSERYDAFMRLVRERLGPEPRLLYAAATETAVYIPDGARAGAMVAELEALARQIDPEADIQVRFEELDFQPYLIQTLNIIGPDQQVFVAENVPATTPVRDIPHAVLGEYAADAREDRFGRNRRMVVDRVEPGTDGGPPRMTRLEPEHTLHEAGVEEGDQLQVQADSTAGAMAGQRRIEALARVRNEIEEYAAGHPFFKIITRDDNLLPEYYEIEFDAPGFGPPNEPAGDDERVNPVLQDTHRLSLMLPEQFPLFPPFVLFSEPFFHPNIQAVAGSPGQPLGTACLGPIRDAYRPDLDFHDLCQLLVDIASWRNYGALPPGVLDSHGFLDPVAAGWALSPEGQQRIVARGGLSLAVRERVEEVERRPLPIQVRHAGLAVIPEPGDER
ncbi:effector-associated domain EAD1-containing protein [Actinoplanes sp. NPDC049118]|uniref:effector-associated domain EAD1-containing protein n=1 Tax=Actinoplanes sp. NPDC049118 TaxID=3155769 RepID=UPI003401B9F7